MNRITLRLALGKALVFLSLAHGAASAQSPAPSDFDIKGLKFGMSPADVKKQLSTLGPVSDRTLIDFKYLDDQGKPTNVAGYKFCIVQGSSCKETYVVAFTDVTQKAYHINRVVTGKQIAPLRTLASQFSQKYRIAQLDQYDFDLERPYWVLFFQQDATGAGELIGGQEGDCGAFAYGGADFDNTPLRVPTRSSSRCPAIVGAIQLVRNGQVKDLADGVSIYATQHTILDANNIERTRRRLMKEQGIRESVQGNKVDL